MAEKNQTAASCDYKNGTLPSCAPLAVPYVPFQQVNPPMYTPEEGLNRGTMFNGLYLPYKNTDSSSNAAASELGQVMALCFSVDDMGLYLDTHPDDTDMLKKYTEQVTKAKAAMDAWVKKYGPLQQTQVTLEGGYTWLKNPWPWDVSERMGSK